MVATGPRGVKLGAMTAVALGAKAHTGWAMLVAIAGPVTSPTIVTRERVVLVEGGFERAGVYHASLEVELPAARALVERIATEARQSARRALASLIEAQREVVACGVVAAKGRPPPPDLEAILRSHALVHAAEGELYRDALVRAAGSLDLTVVAAPIAELEAAVAGALPRTTSVAQVIAELGRAAGRPWAQDHKEAALAALAALVAARRGSRPR